MLAVTVLGLITFAFDVPKKTIADIGSPDNVQILTEDYDAFWRAYDASQNADGSLNQDSFAKEYNSDTSPRLAEFSTWRYMDSEAVFQTADMADFYNSYRHSFPPATYYQRDPIIAGYKILRQYLPDAPLPNISIFMGQMNNGGTVVSDAIIIGHEMKLDFDAVDWKLHPKYTEEFANRMETLLKSYDTPYPEQIILHELIHYIQMSKQTFWTRFTMKTEMIQRQIFGRASLLDLAMTEGIANFLMSILYEKAGDSTVARDKWVLENNAESSLWQEFRADIALRVSQDVVGKWMYNFNIQNRPTDMGYWMGEKIAQAYWNQATDKKQAFHDLIYAQTNKDFRKILEQSGYNGDSLR